MRNLLGSPLLYYVFALCSVLLWRCGDCQEQQQPEKTTLLEGAAINPFARGCLQSKVPGWTKWRVCNSDDDNDALCRPSDFPNYLEVRVKCQDWESVIFGSWVLQIILSELLEVPTTLETGDPTAVMQFYDADDRFEFGTSANNFAAFRHAAMAHGDCRNLKQPANGTYLNCAHVIPEVWTARSTTVQGLIREGLLDPATALGALGTEGWYVPRFTLDADPSLASWVGLVGNDDDDDVRHKLARMFLRPTKWGDYCDEISPTQCELPDAVANRPPQTDYERTMLFKEGMYTGHFRNTTENDCETYPDSCTGHIGDFPCGWGGSLEATCYHLNIALKSNGDEPYSGGWTYGQLGQMWKAANATRNHVAIMWAIPDPIYEAFQGTDFEFVKVTLPAPTQKCLKNRIVAEDRCSPDPALRLGVPEGVCDENARPLHKLVLSELATLTKGDHIPEAIQSPAHDVVSQFTITELQINEMFSYWQIMDSPREAICQWVVDNLEDIQQQYVPQSYPRTFESDESASSSPGASLQYGTTILGGLAFLLVMATTTMVYLQRKRRVFRYAQIEFLYLLLAGSASVAVGAILQGLEDPTDATCVSQIWLTSLGYTLELVPLLVKVAAINRLMQAASRMRRVKLQRSSLRGGVAAISLMVALALLAWTIIDPPRREADYELTDRETNELDRATIISIEYYCKSQSDFWEYIAVIWNVILILCAAALAFQSRTVKQDFNESQVLSRLIYSHFLFVMLRIMSFFFPLDVADAMRSIIYSLDTILVVLIYFMPKFLADDETGVIGQPNTRVSGLDFPGVSHLGGSINYTSNVPSMQFHSSNKSSQLLNATSGRQPSTARVTFAPESAQESFVNAHSEFEASDSNSDPTETGTTLPFRNDSSEPDEDDSTMAMEKLSDKLNKRANRKLDKTG